MDHHSAPSWGETVRNRKEIKGLVEETRKRVAIAERKKLREQTLSMAAEQSSNQHASEMVDSISHARNDAWRSSERTESNSKTSGAGKNDWKIDMGVIVNAFVRFLSEGEGDGDEEFNWVKLDSQVG